MTSDPVVKDPPVPWSWTGLIAGSLVAAVLMDLGLAVAASFMDLEAAQVLSDTDWGSALVGLAVSVALYALFIAGARWPANRTRRPRRWFALIAATIPCLLNFAMACVVFPDLQSEYAGWWVLKLAVNSIILGAPAVLGAVVHLRLAAAGGRIQP